MNVPTDDQLAAAVYVYDHVVGDDYPNFAERILAMREALRAVMISEISNTPPMAIAIDIVHQLELKKNHVK